MTDTSSTLARSTPTRKPSTWVMTGLGLGDAAAEIEGSIGARHLSRPANHRID
jgi:hypothetical protein